MKSAEEQGLTTINQPKIRAKEDQVHNKAEINLISMSFFL